MKKIIFLALGFPDASKSTNIYTDLIYEFHKNGHEVLVLAPAVNKEDIGLRKEAGVSVLRVKTLPLFNVGAIKKGVANLLLARQYKKALLNNNIELDFDLILMPTPPITLTSVAAWLKSKTGGKLYLILRDIFPQNAVDLRMMKDKGLLHNYFRKKEEALYTVSDAIGCMSPANVNYVKEHNPNMDFSKLHLLPNWENLPVYKEEIQLDSLVNKYGLKDKFILIFGGNIGKPQKLENIVNLAKNCLDYPEIVFFIIGTGTEKERIFNMAKELKLPNVILENKLPKADYNNLLRIADVGLISLSEDFTIPNFPSKVLSYYGNKIPVLASVDLQTDFGTILEEINSGLWAEAGKTGELKDKLLLLYNNPDLRRTMGQNGYDYMKNNLLPDNAYNTILEKTIS